MSQVVYYGSLGVGLGDKEERSGRVKVEDLLGVESLSPEEKRRLARLSEALIIVLQTMVEACRDEDDG